MVHPVVLFAGFVIWSAGTPLWPVIAAVALYGTYQTLYWNVLAPPA